MSSIYVITAGDYSEYHVVSVWSNKEEAERIAQAYNNARGGVVYEVEEYPLDSFARNSTDRWGVTAEYNFEEFGYDVSEENIVVKETIAMYYGKSSSTLRYPDRIVARALTVETARKIIFDEVAQLKAQAEGLVL